MLENYSFYVLKGATLFLPTLKLYSANIYHVRGIFQSEQ